jgi:serine/threonine-protein kinase
VLEEASDTIHGSLESPEKSDVLGDLRARGLLAKPGPTMPGAPVEVSASPTMVDAKVEPAVAPAPPASAQNQEGPRPPSKTFRILAVGFALLLPVAVVAGVRVAQNRTASIELERQDRIDAATSALARRAWAAPPGANVKDLTGEMLVRDPQDQEALDIRRQAAEQIMSEALQRKFEGAREQALTLAKLAQELAPELKSAEVVIAELEKLSASTSAPPSASAPPVAEPKPSAKSGRPEPKPGPATSTKPSASTPTESIDPPPAPDLVPPPPNSTGKWL